MHLSGHGVETRAGICLHILNGFLQAAHGSVELANGVVGLLDEGAHDGVVLGDLGGDVFLALEKRSDVALKLNNFAGDGCCGTRTDEAAANRAHDQSGAESSEIAITHENSSSSVTLPSWAWPDEPDAVRA